MKLTRWIGALAAALVLPIAAATPASATPEDGKGCAGSPAFPQAYVCVISTTPTNAVPTTTTTSVAVPVPRLCYVADCVGPTTVDVPVPGAQPGTGAVAVLWYQDVYYPIAVGQVPSLTLLQPYVTLVSGLADTAATTATGLAGTALSTAGGAVTTANNLAGTAVTTATNLAGTAATTATGLAGTALSTAGGAVVTVTNLAGTATTIVFGLSDDAVATAEGYIAFALDTADPVVDFVRDPPSTAELRDSIVDNTIGEGGYDAIREFAAYCRTHPNDCAPDISR
ncbi:MAG TPA: hypothetical protein VGX28_02015 [Frankiaceae bacterium]|nr:hypothetical protein [Frankiaceae bacterium]